MNIARYALAVGALALGVSSVSACGGGNEGVEVSGAWARTSPKMSSAGAVYFDLSSDDGDVLTGASIDSSIARIAELHETKMDDSSMEGTDDDSMDGTMVMVAVETVDIPGGATVSFKPGGFHVMLLDLVTPLEEGQEFDLTLFFETSGEQVVKIVVRDSAS